MDRDEKDEQQPGQQLLKSIIIIFGYIMLCLIPFLSYADIQKAIFASNSTVLFVDNHSLGMLIGFLAGALPIVVGLGIKNYWFINKFIYQFKFLTNLKIAIVISILLLILSFSFMMNSFTYIDNTGIIVKENVFSQNKHYTFDQIDYAELKTEYGTTKSTRYRLFAKYYLYLEDSYVLSIDKSLEFSRKALEVDQLLNNNNVTIHREKIDDKKFFDLLLTLNDPEVLEKLFRFDPSYKRSSI